MTVHNVKLMGWAPYGEPLLTGRGVVALNLQLSEVPSNEWKSAFQRLAQSAPTRHNGVKYAIQGNLLEIRCPKSIVDSVVNGARELVFRANLPVDASELRRRDVAEPIIFN